MTVKPYAEALIKLTLNRLFAFASECRLILAQGKADEKANEITVIRTLLHLLAIKGASITIAAMGCQKDIAQIIIEKGKLCLGA